MKCPFCKTPCGNSWCDYNSPTRDEIYDSRQEEKYNQFNKNWVKSDNYKKVEKWLKLKDKKCKKLKN
jgi:hypothetical protein